MSHFAEIDGNGIVLRVIVAEQDFIDSGAVGNPANWIQTSYNTYEGVNKEGGTALRKNYAGIGYIYDKVRDAFIPPKPFASWSLDTMKGIYKAPKTKPPIEVLPLSWDEAKGDWQ